MHFTSTLSLAAGFLHLISGATAAVTSSDSAPAAAPLFARATAGCGKTHCSKGLTRPYNITSGDRQRRFFIHLPPDYDKNKPYPLVLGFHGTQSIGTYFEVDTNLSNPEFSAGKIMVYPDGVGGAWAGASYSNVSVAVDTQFIADLLDFLRSDYCIDDSRIYATGMSNGGGFVNILACSPELSGQFAAFAPASGSYYYPSNPADCQPARVPLPILSFHGGNDTTVPYNGGQGEGGLLPPIPEWLAGWADRNLCPKSGETVEDSFNGDVQHYRWASCAGSDTVVMEHYKIDDMGHCWASTVPTFSQIYIGQGPTPINASTLIIEFFDRFQKPY